MGKDFTSAKGDDNVFTPYSMTEQFLKREYFDKNKKTFECACGNLAIMKVLHKQAYKGWGNDISIDDKYDFLTYETYFKPDYIITNPPYSQLDKFIAKAKQIAQIKFAFLCKITHLGSIKRFTEKTFLDPEYPLTRIYMFTRQANLRFFDKEKEIKKLSDMIDGHQETDLKYYKLIEKLKKQIDYPELREDGKYPAGMYYYCWLVWENINYKLSTIKEHGTCGPYPTFHWINNNKYILRKEDI